MFNPPDGLGTWALFSWFAVTVVMLRQSMTFYHTPHMALGSELRRDILMGFAGTLSPQTPNRAGRQLLKGRVGGGKHHEGPDMDTT